jgi:ATP-dependent RNA helicase RhlE
LAAFRAGEARVLVATDIAARGIDVDGVSHVVNFELPNVPEDYVHRIGRTARAGAAGIAVAFCSNEERPYLRDIEKLTRRSIPMMPALAIDLKPGPMPRQEDRPAAPARSAPVRVGGPDRDDRRAAQVASLPGFLRGGKDGGGRDRKTGPTTSFRGRRTKRSSMSHRPTAVL